MTIMHLHWIRVCLGGLLCPLVCFGVSWCVMVRSRDFWCVMAGIDDFLCVLWFLLCSLSCVSGGIWQVCVCSCLFLHVTGAGSDTFRCDLMVRLRWVVVGPRVL
jgi:hypothetical protein